MFVQTNEREKRRTGDVEREREEEGNSFSGKKRTVLKLMIE